jgi:hypothetical protein
MIWKSPEPVPLKANDKPLSVTVALSFVIVRVRFVDEPSPTATGCDRRSGEGVMTNGPDAFPVRVRLLVPAVVPVAVRTADKAPLALCG